VIIERKAISNPTNGMPNIEKGYDFEKTGSMGVGRKSDAMKSIPSFPLNLSHLLRYEHKLHIDHRIKRRSRDEGKLLGPR
jgi:hypothetical protein